MSGAFVTGFPGFLGSALVERLAERGPVTCLVQPAYREEAERRRAAIEGRCDTDGRIRIVEGDVKRDDLGLGAARSRAQERTTAVYHLAAAYDLGVDRETGMAVNVRGTENVLEFAAGCPGLERVHHASTCYVGGRYGGTFTEDHLREGQLFNNHYETTKYLAEVRVHERMAEGLPATVYRPSVVVGDSTTGRTHKYDGPYMVLRWLLRQPPVGVLPVVGDPRRHELDVVPRDFVADAIVHLSGLERSEGRVYHLANPDPPTVDEVIRIAEHATGTRAVRVPVPKAALKRVLDGTVGRLAGIQPELVDYFDHPTRYATDATEADLAGAVECPPFASYADRLVRFVREHPEIGADAMI